MYNASRILLKAPPITLCQKCLVQNKAKPDKDTYTNSVILPKTALPLRLRGNRIVERDQRILKVCVHKFWINLRSMFVVRIDNFFFVSKHVNLFCNDHG